MTDPGTRNDCSVKQFQRKLLYFANLQDQNGYDWESQERAQDPCLRRIILHDVAKTITVGLQRVDNSEKNSSTKFVFNVERFEFPVSARPKFPWEHCSNVVAVNLSDGTNITWLYIYTAISLPSSSLGV